MYGFRLQHLRYDKTTEALVQNALERDHWSREQWLSWQAMRLEETLDHSARYVPYYRELWQKRRRQGDRSSWTDLSNWPILNKRSIREYSHAFLSERNREKLVVGTTSGSTGIPIKVYATPKMLKSWYALFEARCRRWNDVSLHDNWAMVGGKDVVSPRRRRPPFWVWNSGMKQLYLSSIHVRRESAKDYVEALTSHDVRYIICYPSSLYMLALFASKESLQSPKIDVVISNAEPLAPFHRTTIEGFFQCPVRNTYGMSEMVVGSSECSSGALHLWPEVGYIEVIGDDSLGQLEKGQVGQILATGLLENAMSFIRYDTGDRGRLGSLLECGCGRQLPQLESIEGRSDDFIHTVDGLKIARLDHLFLDIPILEGQIRQETSRKIHINIVPDGSFTDKDEKKLIRWVVEKLGDVTVEVHKVERIERGKNNKFKMVVSDLNTH